MGSFHIWMVRFSAGTHTYLFSFMLCHQKRFLNYLLKGFEMNNHMKTSGNISPCIKIHSSFNKKITVACISFPPHFLHLSTGVFHKHLFLVKKYLDVQNGVRCKSWLCNNLGIDVILLIWMHGTGQYWLLATLNQLD